MNKALVSKLGWRLLHDQRNLWAMLVRKKYKVGDIHDKSWLVAKNGCSSTWRSILSGVREVMEPGISWVIGNGRSIKFWSDRWMFNKRLADEAVMELPLSFEDVRVCDMWRNGFGWDMSRITPFVSGNTKLELMAVVLDNVTGARD